MGLAKAFNFLGHQVAFLNEVEQSQIEIISRFCPDLAILNSYNLTNDGVRGLKETGAKAFLRVFDNGPQRAAVKRVSEKTGIDYKIEFARDKDIVLVEEVAKNGNLLGMFNHYHEDDLEETLGFWQEIGPVYSSMLACDTFLYEGGKVMKEFDSDCCFIGSFHKYKAINLSPYIVDINRIKSPTQIRCKIFSTWHWPSEYYCGSIPESYNRHALKSSRICLNISEPHSTQFGTDPIERYFYNLWTGNFLVSDYCSRAVSMFPDSHVYCKTASEFHDAILHYLKYPNEKKPIMDRAKEAGKEHTYINRAKEILAIYDSNICS